MSISYFMDMLSIFIVLERSHQLYGYKSNIIWIYMHNNNLYNILFWFLLFLDDN